MSLIQQVADIVKEKQRASIDDIHVEGKTREQIQKAMQNAVQRRLIEADEHRQGRGRSNGRGRLGSIYVAVTPKVKPVYTRAPASVWDLGRMV